MPYITIHDDSLLIKFKKLLLECSLDYELGVVAFITSNFGWTITLNDEFATFTFTDSSPNFVGVLSKFDAFTNIGMTKKYSVPHLQASIPINLYKKLRTLGVFL